MKKAIRMDARDNIATALQQLTVDDKVTVVTDAQEIVRKIIMPAGIPFGHKFALGDIKKGSHIFKYGEIIGIAIKDIREGEHVHIHNIDSLRLPIPEAVRERGASR
jgi:altronate dehydratase small subunit